MKKPALMSGCGNLKLFFFHFSLFYFSANKREKSRAKERKSAQSYRTFQVHYRTKVRYQPKVDKCGFAAVNKCVISFFFGYISSFFIRTKK